MNILYTETELQAMSMDDLQKLIDAAWAMLQAHKSYVHRNHCLAELVSIDHELTNNWYTLEGVWTNRARQIRHAWQALITAAIETKADQDSAIAHTWYAIAKIAYMSDPESNSQALSEMESYVIDLIWEKSDTPTLHVKQFKNEYWKYTTVKKPNTRKTNVCRKWAQADWTFGQPDFKNKLIVPMWEYDKTGQPYRTKNR